MNDPEKFHKYYERLMEKVGEYVAEEAVRFGAPVSLLDKKNIIALGEAMTNVIIYRGYYQGQISLF